MNTEHPTPAKAERSKQAQHFNFKELIKQEHERLDQATPTITSPHEPATIAEPGRADEPWVSFTDRDLFGLALSGGGIRSATFNLGLLQALERKRLLKNVDYLSTVSGGGYVGGFWTAWQQRANQQPGDNRHFPTAAAEEPDRTTGPDIREQPEIRHLREFSRFLMPRVGFFYMETWAGVVTILGGLLPSLTAAVSVLTLLHYKWFYIGFHLIKGDPQWSWICLGALVFVHQSVCEYSWWRSGKAGNTRQPLAIYVFFALGAAALSGLFWLLWRNLWMDRPLEDWLCKTESVWQSDSGKTYPVDTAFDFVLFGPAAATAFAGLVLLVCRAISSRMVNDRDSIRWSSSFDRAAARCFAPALMWAGLATVWEVCHWLLHQNWKFAATTGSTATFGVLFVWLRDWLIKPTEENIASTLVGRIAEKLKPMVPQLLAIAFVLSMLVAVGVMVQAYGLGWPLHVAAGAGSALLLIGGTLIFFDPARVGMHDFYRSRICRCFLGAARATGQTSQHPTAEQFGDDLTFAELRESTKNQRPIHLVCCAANNLAGDTLGSLYRGARSTTISPFGISLGNYVATCDDLRFSSALTASAAAFNSQMGRISMDLGPAVAFIMSAFNLRLGLWVPHPLIRNPRPPLLVGRPFFYEMFGHTNCDPIPPDDGGERLHLMAKKSFTALSEKLPNAARHATRSVMNMVANEKTAAACAQKAADLSDKMVEFSANRVRDVHFLHLSDGAHFENLGLYELIRRHCRYLIVSDCGTDPEVAFDDLAIALRSIREDFGVEIDLDVSPLRADDSGHARQHAVVGTIHYDGFGGTDKGTIILFKPSLTGDEPSDVSQYQARHPAFPHETTGDQFYDEAQWESYRRLGEHAGDSVFRQLENYFVRKTEQTQFVENVFLEATQRWKPGPERQSDSFLALSERCASLETTICENAPAKLRAEFFPEVGASFAAPEKPKKAKPDDAEDCTSPLEDEVRTAHYMMLVAQVMEDAWVTADLETNWAHPLNEGWMNYFQRWASTPSFRRWWPILRPIYNIRFRDFVRDRFNIRIKDVVARNEPAGPGSMLKLVPLDPAEQLKTGFAWQHWLQRHGPLDLAGMQAFEYQLALESIPDGLSQKSFQAGFLLCTQGQDDGGSFVQWDVQHLFVPHSLIGSGIVARLLEAIVGHFKKLHAAGQGPDWLQVLLDTELKPPAAKTPVQAGTRQSDPAKAETVPDMANVHRDPGHRLQRVHLINFYKSRGFLITAPESGNQASRLMRLKLKH